MINQNNYEKTFFLSALVWATSWKVLIQRKRITQYNFNRTIPRIIIWWYDMFLILILILTTAISDYLKINLFSLVFIEWTYVWHTTTFFFG